MSTAALAPGLARKVRKILEIKTESADLISALNTLSTFYEENTPAARRQLRSTIERRGLDINHQFLSAAETVTKSLDDVQEQLDELASACTAISGALAAAKGSTGALLAEAERSQRELVALDARAAAVQQFLEQYQLTPEEVVVLQGGQVGPPFFAALQRVRAIHENCKGLLRSAAQRAGLELMDQMAAYQEGAYEHLCRWVQAQCRGLSEHDAPEVDTTLTAAVAALRERPVLFKYCAEEVAAARHGALFQRFIIALTRGGPGGLPRPIEMHAHDPRRYVADMLAWLHQALASERELVAALFGGGGGERGGWDGDGDEGGSGDGGDDGSGDGGGSVGTAGISAAMLLDRIFESVCRPLRVRVEQVLMMSPPLLLCFQLAQLCDFYHQLVTRITGAGAALATTIASCRDAAQRAFLEQLRGAGERLLRSPPAPPPDLSPPPVLGGALQMLTDVMNAYESSLQGAAPGAGASGDAGGFSTVLDAVLDPLLQVVSVSAESLAADSPARLDEGLKMDPNAAAVYTINCLSACQAVTSLRPFCAERTEALAAAVAEQLGVLVRGEVGRLLARCGMAEVVDRIKLYKASGGSGPLASDPALSLHVISECLRSFFVAVSSPDALPEFRAIQAPRLRAETTSRVACALVEAYELVYATLDDPTSGYPELGGVAAIKHTPAQVRTILGVL